MTRLLSQTLPTPACRDLLNLWIGNCPQCRTLVERLLGEPESLEAAEAPEETSATGTVFEGLEQRVRGWRLRSVAERREAPQAVRDLLALDPDQRLQALGEERRLRTLPVARLLGEASRVAGFQDPAKALELATLGEEVARHLAPDFYGKSLIADAQAAALAFVGNAHRLAGDQAAAEEALLRADLLLKQGTGIPLAAVEVRDFEAALRREQHRFDRALRLLESVVATWVSAGERRLTARVLIVQGCVLEEAGQPQRALDPLRRALASIDSERDAHLYTWALHRLTLCLAASGDTQAALSQLAEAQRRCGDHQDRLALLELRRMEGRLALENKDRLEAETAFIEARRGFLELGGGYDAALVSLDLAGLYVRQGAQAKLQLLAQSLHPVMGAGGVHAEATATLKIFQQAVRLRAASPELVEDLARHLRQARYRPLVPPDLERAQ